MWQRSWSWGSAAGLAIILCGSTLPAQERPQGPQRPPEADEMFRTLDTNRDGRITIDDATDRNRTFLQRVFQQAGKETSETITRDEFRALVEKVRGGQAPGARPAAPPENRTPENRPPGNRPSGETSGNRPSGNRPGERPATGTSGSADRPTGGSATSRPGERSTTGNPRGTATAGRSDATGGNRANRLAGVWRGWVVDGRGDNPNTGHMQMELRIEGNQLTAREIGGNRGGGGPEGLGAGTFVATAEGNRGNLDATGTTGRYDGIEYLGIFEVDGDTLKWCVGNRGRPRPREFATERGNYYMILRRE